METFEDDYPKNIYVIRRKLASLPAKRGDSHFEYPVGRYNVHIYLYGMQDIPCGHGNILDYKTVNVVLNEVDKSGSISSISLRDDPQFSNYEPIQYNVINTPNGKINLSNGDNMPILQLCELICYLYRLSNLTAFI